MKKQMFSLFMAVTALGVLGCNREQVQSVRVEKTAPVPLPPGHPVTMGAPAGAPGAAMPPAAELPPPPTAEAGAALKWTLPKGWSETQGSGMRYATLKPAASGNVEASVVMLTGAAGGELANLNRWRGQLGLPQVDETAMAQARKVVKSKAGPVSVFELNNAGNRMVVGLLSAPTGNTWFLKLVGEDAPVNQAKPDFIKLLGTLTLG